MLLRRIIGHVRRQEWTAIAIDFLIVVAGVFLGLQASNWNDERGTRAEARLLVSRLAEEFDLIATRLDDQIAYYYGNMVDTNALIEFVEGAPTFDADDLKVTLRQVTTRRLPPRRSATFTAIMSSGKADLISDSALLNALIGYDNHAQLLADVFAFNSDVVRESETSVFTSVRFETDPALIAVANIGPIRSIDVDALRADAAVLPALQAVFGAHENMHALLVAQRDNVREVRRLLEAADAP